MKLLLTIIISFTTLVGFSQPFFISDAETYNQSNPMDCGALGIGGTNFFDQGGNYDPNMDEYAVYCPDLAQGSKVSIAFATNIGYEWNVDGSDTLYVYDGPSTAANLLGAFNSVTNPNGPHVQASFENNPSGCLTVRFVSDGAVQGTGWIAKIACGNLPQPFEPHLEAFIDGDFTASALNPVDTGYVNVCGGDSILLVAKPVFPYSFENTGFGYSQTVDNASYKWEIAGYPNITTDNDSLWFVPPGNLGYYVDCKITDPFPQPQHIHCKIRTSQHPSFDGTGPLQDSVCFNIPVELAGGVTPTDTVGIDIPPAVFPSLGSFAGLTALPDGSGVSYADTIVLDDLTSGGVVTDGSDINMICLDIEHSFLGDLEIGLRCPNGTLVSLANTYPASGMFAGGCSGGDLFLGNDTDLDGEAPGSPVEQYCFSPTNNTLGIICDELGNTVVNTSGFDMLNPDGIYLPDGNFDQFIGCPLNGPWSIVIQDNQGVDDGYIFEWSIVFDTDLYPNLETYQNVIVSENWTSDPTIISGQSDTAIIVLPTAIGPHNYTYNVVDDFGCHYDTTVVLYVMDHPTIFADTAVCDFAFNAHNNFAFLGGVWTCADTNVHFLPNANALNPTFISTVAGTFTVTFTDNACNDVLSRNITFKPYPWTEVNDNVNCQGEAVTLLAYANPDNDSYVWNNGATGNSIAVDQPGIYWVTAYNDCGEWTDSATVQTFICDIDAPNILALSSTQGNNEWFINYNGLIDYHIAIVNRWQNVVFESSNPADKWKGLDNNGNKVSEGTYFYSIKATLFSGKVLEKEGFIQVYH